MTKRNGFTLIEILSSTAVLSILLLGAVTVFTTSLLSQSKARIRRVLKLEGEQIISTIDYELKNAQEIVDDCTGVTRNVIQFQRTSDNTNTIWEFKKTGENITLGMVTDPVTTPDQLNSSKVKITTAQPFICEENPDNNAKFITANFALTNAQAGELHAEADGSISESFRTGVSFRNFKAN